MDGHKGGYMAEAGGAKVYVFCYMFGYIIALTDPNLTVLAYMTSINDTDLPDLTDRPDVVAAEMLIDGSLDTLAMNGSRLVPNTVDGTICPIVTERPYFIYRGSAAHDAVQARAQPGAHAQRRGRVGERVQDPCARRNPR